MARNSKTQKWRKIKNIYNSKISPTQAIKKNKLIKLLFSNFLTQTKYIEYMGATIGSLLYKSFKIPETIDIINKTVNIYDKILNLF